MWEEGGGTGRRSWMKEKGGLRTVRKDREDFEEKGYFEGENLSSFLSSSHVV